MIGGSSLQEARSLAVLAFPLVLTQLSQMGMSVIDFIFTGRVGVVDFAGVSLGTSLFWPVSLLATGILVALTATVAQLYGADQVKRIGPGCSPSRLDSPDWCGSGVSDSLQ